MFKFLIIKGVVLKLIKTSSLLGLCLFSVFSWSDCWTGKAEGMIQYSNGKAAIDFNAASMGAANPADATWSCKGNWVWIKVPYDENNLASVIRSQSIESRMISLAEAAFKTNTNIRVCFLVDGDYCEARQVYDLGSTGSVSN